MKIKTIFIFSHDGQKRELNFKTDGLNIITGKSSTGKSELSNIIEFCMGRSTNIISDGVISEKVSWFGVIYQFTGIQVLILKPAPAPGAKSVSTVLLIEGSDVQIPEYAELSTNTDDATVIKVLSKYLGIPVNETEVPLENSRPSFKTTIQHTYYYLFQKQNIVTDQDILFYRQKEEFQTQAIKDTLPILLGIESDDKYRIEALLRMERRNLKICDKQIQEADQYHNAISQNGLNLLNEAKASGIITSDISTVTSEDEIFHFLESTKEWNPEKVPDAENGRIWEAREKIEELREQRRIFRSKYDEALLYSKKSNGFSTEAGEQKSRLESMRLLPRNDANEWQWPFSEENLAMDTPIAIALLNDLEELDEELKAVSGAKPALDEYLRNIENQIQIIADEINRSTSELAAIITSNENIKQLQSRNYAASKTLGRISMYLDNYVKEDTLSHLKNRQDEINRRIESLEEQLGLNDTEDRLQQVMNAISMNITEYMRAFEVEFSGKPFYFDINKLEVSFLNGTYPTTLKRTGGGENHLAIHLSTLLGLHRFAAENNRPIPRFLIIDQPSQVYFPKEVSYSEVDGTEEGTEAAFIDHDIAKVKKMFRILYDFTTEDLDGFQLIVTEHANFRDKWFQNVLVEPTWSKPPALVPQDWPTLEEFTSRVQ